MNLINKEKMNKVKRKGILLLGGSFNPVHSEHINMLVAIREYMETYDKNIEIVEGYLVVTTDKYGGEFSFDADAGNAKAEKVLFFL